MAQQAHKRTGIRSAMLDEDHIEARKSMVSGSALRPSARVMVASTPLGDPSETVVSVRAGPDSLGSMYGYGDIKAVAM